MDGLGVADFSAISEAESILVGTPPPLSNSHRATTTRFTVTGGVPVTVLLTREANNDTPFPCRVASSCIRCLRTRCAGLPVTSSRRDATSRCSSTTRPDVRPDSSTIARRPAVAVVPTRKSSPWRAAVPADKPWWSAASTGSALVLRDARFTGTSGATKWCTPSLREDIP